jgi:hypothetical protein
MKKRLTTATDILNIWPLTCKLEGKELVRGDDLNDPCPALVTNVPPPEMPDFICECECPVGCVPNPQPYTLKPTTQNN